MVAPGLPSIRFEMVKEGLIAAIHPAFVVRPRRPLALMEYADRGLISVAHSK
jgi:hypothetical protein